MYCRRPAWQSKVSGGPNAHQLYGGCLDYAFELCPGMEGIVPALDRARPPRVPQGMLPVAALRRTHGLLRLCPGPARVRFDLLEPGGRELPFGGQALRAKADSPTAT